MKFDENFVKKFDARWYERFDNIYWDIANNPDRGSIETEIFKKYNNLCHELKNNNKKLEQVLESRDAIPLSKKDVQDLLDYLEFDYYRTIEEEKWMMMEVAKETCIVLYKLGVLKNLGEK